MYKISNVEVAFRAIRLGVSFFLELGEGVVVSKLASLLIQTISNWSGRHCFDSPMARFVTI